MELTDEIVNKGIAEFMGAEFIIDNKTILNGNAVTYILNETGSRSKPYTESLDALVPVWEKLQNPVSIIKIYTGVYNTDIGLENEFKVEYANHTNKKENYGKTIQQAAAYATYRAVKELGLI